MPTTALTRHAAGRPLVALVAISIALLAPLACQGGGSSTGGSSAGRPSRGKAAPIRVATVAPRTDSLRTPRETAFMDTLERRTFGFFWDLTNPANGLTPDRWPTQSFCSVAACGFALTAYPVGVERGYVTRADARRRVLDTLRFFWSAPQDSASPASIGYKGFFYHFLDMKTGHRFEKVELSTIDTALLMAGVLCCQAYFDAAEPEEGEIRALADSLYRRVDWRWAQVRPPTLVLGWTPEQGPLPYDWRGYDEAMILQVLALGSPTHPATGDVWGAWTAGYKWGDFQGQSYLGFAPLFGHQFSHVWIDYRGINEPWLRARGIDYFENSRRATLAQRAYAVANPGGWADYGDSLWGLSACDGPLDGKLTIDGREREFHTYEARGASHDRVTDDGTITPTAAGGSIAFAPEVVLPTLMAMRARYGEPLFGRYGFLDALNPTLKAAAAVHHGRVDPRLGWFDTDYLGIDQGPILLMTENLRTEFVWRTMRKNPYLVAGLKRAGFTGGWLDAAPGPR